MAPCPTGHRQSAVTVAGGLGIAKPSAARATPGQKTKARLFSAGWWSIIPSAQHCPADQHASNPPHSETWQQVPGFPGLGHCQTHRGLPGEVKGIAPLPRAVRVLIPPL